MENAFAEVAAALHALQGEQLRAIQRRGLRRVGEIMQAAVVAKAPEKADGDGGLLAPGELKASIKARVHIASDQEIAEGKSSRVSIGPVGHTASTVAGWVIYGHVARRSKKKEGPPRFIPGNPFIDRAYDESHEAAETAYFETVEQDLEKALP